MNFSQRMGLTPAAKALQINSIDNELKNGLWNVYTTQIVEPIQSSYNHKIDLKILYCTELWHNYYKKPVDRIPAPYASAIFEIRQNFFSCSWFRLYDFIEYNLNLMTEKFFTYYLDYSKTSQAFNNVLEREFSGYRIIGGKIAPITNSTEISEIEEALSSTNGFTALKSCNVHFETAIAMLSDRLNPDYRNSIKESVSAVEAIAKIISNDSSDSLGEALNKIKGSLKIHGALEQGFKKIYGYTSDADGIRHSLTEDPNCDFEDAKFMLVSCSAFVNYLIVKAQKAGVTIG